LTSAPVAVEKGAVIAAEIGLVMIGLV
jgi:hypothetical protein